MPEAAPAAAPASPAPSSSPSAGSAGATTAPGASSATPARTAAQVDTTSAPAGGAPSSTPPPPEGDAAATPPPKTYKAKVYGQEIDVPSGPVEELAKALNIKPEDIVGASQLRRAAYQQMEEVAKARKALEEREKALKAPWEDPRVAEFAKANGMQPEDAFALLRARDLFEREQMSPEARALADERKRREELEKKLKGEEERVKTEAQQRETRAWVEKFNREVPEAAKSVGLPQTPRAGRLMLEHMQTVAKAGLPIDPADAARHAMDTIREENRAILADMADDQIVSFLGKDVVNRILKHSVNQVRAPAPPAAVPPATPKPKAAGFMSPEEWRAKYG